MKKVLLFISLLIAVCASAQLDKVIPARPNPPKLVNDYTGTLTREQIQTLESKLVAYDDSTSTQIAVVIISSLQDYPIEDVSLGILRNWGVGGKENNGVVILIAKDDRKARIEVGYGLEGAVPDITAKSILDNDLLANFKQNDYYRGIDEATDDIFKSAAGEYKAPAGYNSRKGKGGSGFGSLALIIIVIIIVAVSSRGGRGGGGMASRRGFRDFGAGWLIGTLLSGGGGSGGGGGGWSGGGGGGGFGGFGGGSGGGGGASGGW